METFFLIGYSGAISGKKKKIPRKTNVKNKNPTETCAYCGKDCCYVKSQ